MGSIGEFLVAAALAVTMNALLLLLIAGVVREWVRVERREREETMTRGEIMTLPSGAQVEVWVWPEGDSPESEREYREYVAERAVRQ
jgi:hypothetical protein